MREVENEQIQIDNNNEEEGNDRNRIGEVQN
jgi:hypothetical protein